MVLYDRAVEPRAAPNSVRAWKPAVPGIREVLHAQFADHAYPPHTHDTWTLLIVDDGAVRYDLDGRPRAAEQSMVSVLPPHIVHDGRPATSRGFRKRVLYLEADVIGEPLIGPAVDRPAVVDASFRQAISRLHDSLACRDEAFEAETRLAFVAERIRRQFGRAPDEHVATSAAGLAEAFRAYLDARIFEPVTVAAAASQLGAGPTRLTRAFMGAFDIAPHAYVIGRRLDAARDRLLAGDALAGVAADSGFCDQAHFSRRFKQFLGTTPGRFAQGDGRLASTRAGRIRAV